MRVRYDDQIFTWQRRGGISRYFVELIGEFTKGPELGVTPQLVHGHASMGSVSSANAASGSTPT